MFVILIFGLFGFVLAGGNIFKQPLAPEEDIAGFLNQLETALGTDPQWDHAMELQADIEYAWSRIEKRIQLSVEKDDMVAFTEQLVRLKSAIEVEERPAAWEALGLLKTTWHRMR